MILAVGMAIAEDEAPEASYPSSPPIGIDDAETVEKGHCEINLTTGFSGKSRAWESELPLVDGNIGITDNIHINAEIPYVLGEEEGAFKNGFGRAALAVKVRVLHRKRVQLAFHPAVEFPPLPAVGIEKSGDFTVTIPVVLDLAVGSAGSGIGLQLSRSFTRVAADDVWGAAVGFATPIDEASDLMFDYTQEADPSIHLGEGWFEVGYVRGNLFGSEHLTLLSSIGRSTQNNTNALLGVQVGI